MRRAFVTGVAGQDGSYLAELLLAEGWEVHGLVRSGDDPVHVAPAVIIHEGDVVDEPRIMSLLNEIQPAHLYNLAGVSSVAYAWEHPVETTRSTGLAAVTLMDAALRLQGRTGVPVRFVQASSAEIFGAPSDSPQSERTPVQPLNPYAAAKALAHHSARILRSRGLHCSSMVLFNHESPRRPESFVSRKITSAVARIACGSSERLRLGNLDARRDWGWAPDHVRALWLAAEAEVPDDYVIATGTAHSVRELVAAAFAHVGIVDWERHVEIDRSLLRPSDSPIYLGDSASARARLRWEPTTSFEELVGRMVDAEPARSGVSRRNG